MLRARRGIVCGKHQRALAMKQLRPGGAREEGINRHSQRLADPRPITQAYVEPRIVGAYRSSAGEYRTAARPPFLHIGARGLAADPNLPPRRRRGARIQAHRHLQADEGTAALEAREKSDIELTRRRREHTDGYFDSG